MALYDIPSFNEFEETQSKGIFGVDFNSLTPKKVNKNTIPIEENPYADQGLKDVISLRKFSGSPISKPRENLLERALQGEKPITTIASNDSSESTAEKKLSSLSQRFKDIESIKQTITKNEGNDNIPFVGSAINPSKDTSLGDVGKLKQQIADKESFGGQYGLMSKVSSATGKYQFLWGTWGKDIEKVTGVKSRNDFAKNPQAQENFFDWYLDKKIKPSIDRLQNLASSNGVSKSELARLIHFRGEGGARTLIKKGTDSWDKEDSKNNMSINKYLNRGKHKK